MRKVQNQDELFIMNGTISSHVADGVSFLSDWKTLLEDGEIVLVNMATNQVHNTTFPTSGNYRFYAKAGNSLLMSNIFDAATVTKTKRIYTAQTEQVDYVGYNASAGTGNMDGSVARGEIFTLHLHILGSSRTDFNQAMIKEGHFITTTTSTWSFNIATGLVNSLIANFSRFPNPVMRFERVTNEAADNSEWATATVGDATVTYGDPIVTVATSTATLNVGDYVRFGSDATERVTDPVYRITALTATTVTLDVPYQGASGSYDSDYIHAIPTAEITGVAGTEVEAWGLKLTGIAQPYVIQKYPPKIIQWAGTFTKIDANAKEATPDAVVTTVTTPVLGSGTYAQVAEMERELQMGDGYQLYSDIPMHAEYRQQADSTKTYNLVHIKHVKNMTSHLGQEVPSLCGITLALDTAVDYTSFALFGTTDDASGTL